MDKGRKDFLKNIDSIENEYDYFKSYIGYLLSPVLTGIKPSSSISFKVNCKKHFENYKKYGQEIFRDYELASKLIKEDENGVLLLVYDEENLKQHLNCPPNRKFLLKEGYSSDFDLEDYLNILTDRINCGDFPHEAGIFMGIPIEDVSGYINGRACIYKGPWKVYDKIERSMEVFKLYEESRELYVSNLQDFKSIKNRFKYKREKFYIAV